MARLLRCPRCGKVFSIEYARVVSCSGCPVSYLSCSYVKCPYCGYEGSIESFSSS